MNRLYPLLFLPIPVKRVWGGERWLLSGLEGNNSVVSNGFLSDNEINELIEVYMGDLVGDTVFQKYAQEFPLLIKTLEINDYLSFQVHPSDEIAKKRHNAYGKAEVWVVLKAEPSAVVYLGFNRPITPNDFRERCLNQTLPEVMNEFTPRQGDCFYIPPGTVHAAGGGLVVAEIQQTSDITYRVYDWGREFIKESAREMHLDLAIESIHFEPYRLPKPKSFPFVISEEIVQTQSIVSIHDNECFNILICINGEVTVNANLSARLQMGEAVLIPAVLSQYEITPEVPGSVILKVGMTIDSFDP